MAALTAIVATPAFASSPLTSAEAGVADRGAWDKTLAKLQLAEAEYDAHAAAFEPLFDACTKETDTVPHVTLVPDPYSGKAHPVSTANSRDVADARRDTRGRYWVDPQYPSVVAHYDLMERLKAAADARDGEVERIRQRYGWHEACDRRQSLYEAY